MINKKTVKELETWNYDTNREYDYIYILPTQQKMDGYKTAYYIGQIGDEIKIITRYDCGNNFGSDFLNPIGIQWDFEGIIGGIKVWSTKKGKIKYNFGGFCI